MTPDEIAASFELQSDWCAAMGAPVYAALLRGAADDVRSDGPVASIVDGFPNDPVAAALGLRLMGGVHRLVLMGVAPRLARHYPSLGGEPDHGSLVGDFLSTVGEHRGYLRDGLAVAPQTNDTGRCAALLPAVAFALGGRRHRVRLLEIGSAAGLNLLMDGYRYEMGAWTWGDPQRETRIEGEWIGAPPSIPGGLDIVDRRGCDVAPIDTTSAEEQLRLLSFVWPDHARRFARMQAAIRVAEAAPPTVDRADAGPWLVERLTEDPGRRTLTIVQHSCVWQYLSASTRDEVAGAIERAGAGATRSRPFAHVSFEPDDAASAGRGFVIAVTTWPGGERRTLGFGHPHGARIDWDA